MTEDTKNAALIGIYEAMASDISDLVDMIATAEMDMEEGRRQASIGALCAMDTRLEAIAASLSAARSIHRATRTMPAKTKPKFETMPPQIQTERGVFVRTEYENVTTERCKYGAGHLVREYWCIDKGDAVRLQRLPDGNYYFD